MIERLTLPRLVVAGVQSGAGKTTVALGLVAALRRRGRIVQTYKVGPDLIDSAYLAHVSGRPCRNLDSWMLGPDGVRRALARGAADADCAIVEGAMGIFDCHGLRPEEGRPDAEPFPGSTAEVAHLVSAPVLLVVDAATMAETTAAIALGVRRLDPRLQLLGVVLDGIPSDYHRRLIEDAVWSHATLPVLGALPRMPEVAIPEWRMGLLPVPENPRIDAAIDRLATAVERSCDLDLIERLMATAGALEVAERPRLRPAPQPVRLAVAFDEAFCSYYPENLELLEEAGCEIVPFSPLEDRTLPRDVDGVYLGGGFSAIFAPRLAANRSMLESLARARQAGLPLYGESGGLLLLARSLRTDDGSVHAMAGVLPVDVALDGGAPRAGYRELDVIEDCLLAPAGTRLRGHEFHLSTVTNGGDCLQPAFSMHDCDGEPLGFEGWVDRDLLVARVALHFDQEPSIATRVVERMLGARRGRQHFAAAM